MAIVNTRSTTYTLPSPCKINHFLHILGRRPDQYHDLQTLFQFVDYCDWLTFSARTDEQVVLVHDCAQLSSSDNLIIKAAAQLREFNKGPCPGFTIHLDKRIPIGSGLGGGSSNAATTLFALNHLWGMELSLEQSLQIGATLGADVPIFLYAHSAFGEGIGEKLSALTLKERWLLLLIPPIVVSTAQIFSDPHLTRNSTPITMGDFLAGCGHNDCEAVVRRHYPVVGEALDWLGQFAKAKLTGSGGAVFAEFTHRAEAKAVANKVPLPYHSIVAKACNDSPLRSAAVQYGWTWFSDKKDVLTL